MWMSWGTQKRQEGPALSKETQQLLDAVMKDRGLSQRAMSDVSSSIKRETHDVPCRNSMQGREQWLQTSSKGCMGAWARMRAGGDGAWADHLNSTTASFKQAASKTGKVNTPKFSSKPCGPSMAMPPAR